MRCESGVDDDIFGGHLRWINNWTRDVTDELIGELI